MSRARMLHADETGFRAKDHTRWLHVLATEQHTLYQLHERRGAEAMLATAEGVTPIDSGMQPT